MRLERSLYDSDLPIACRFRQFERTKTHKKLAFQLPDLESSPAGASLLPLLPH